MSGYTPLFDSLTRGSLAGKWPDIGLWPLILSLADPHGVIDCTPEVISMLSGLELDQVNACMERFCSPDPRSGSREYDGRRLLPLEERRGWLIVNHAYYREKARLMGKNARETEERRRKRARS